MKALRFAILVVAFQASASQATTLPSCPSDGTACTTAKATANAQQNSKPAKKVAPPSRRKGHDDDFYSLGLKS